MGKKTESSASVDSTSLEGGDNQPSGLVRKLARKQAAQKKGQSPSPIPEIDGADPNATSPAKVYNFKPFKVGNSTYTLLPMNEEKSRNWLAMRFSIIWRQALQFRQLTNITTYLTEDTIANFTPEIADKLDVQVHDITTEILTALNVLMFQAFEHARKNKAIGQYEIVESVQALSFFEKSWIITAQDKLNGMDIFGDLSMISNLLFIQQRDLAHGLKVEKAAKDEKLSAEISQSPEAKEVVKSIQESLAANNMSSAEFLEMIKTLSDPALLDLVGKV